MAGLADEGISIARSPENMPTLQVTSEKSNVLYKYESMRLKWSRCFEENDPQGADWVKNFFRDRNFYRNHKHFTFVIGELVDGTTQLLVKPATYRRIKEEIEEGIDETLPEVRQITDATIMEEEKTFQDFQSFADFRNAQKEEHGKSVERRKREANKSVRKLCKTLSANPQARILAFDQEVYEHDDSIILEIGYAITTLDIPDEIQTFHFIIQENLRYANSLDNRNRFMFGTSRHTSLREAAEQIQEHIDAADFLVTHSGAHDTEFLASCGVSVLGKPMFDTQILATRLLPDGPLVRDLKRVVVDLHIPFDNDARLHNSGNDAYYTMKVFLALKERL